MQASPVIDRFETDETCDGNHKLEVACCFTLKLINTFWHFQ